ncbi:MAG: FmdB family zinc ribbon protein [Fimbriimonadales bacterium]
MPIYEYLCEACCKRVSLLIGVVAQDDEEVCPECGSSALIRVVSRVSRLRSEDDRLDEVSDRLDMMGEPESYSELRDTLRDVGSAMDEDVSEEMEEMFEGDAEEG